MASLAAMRTDVIRNITVRGRTEGVAETTGQLRQLANAQSGVAGASAQTTRSTLSAEAALAKLRRSVDAQYRADLQMAQAERTLNAARAQGLVTLEEQNRLLALQAAKSDQAAASATRLSGSMRFLVGFGVGLGTSFLFQLPGMIGNIVDEAGKLVDTADKIGITTKALQELKFAGGQTGVEFADLSQGLSFFNKSIGEASRGNGDLYEILKANRVALRDQAGALRPVVDLIGDYAELVKNAGSDQERATLITKAFGRSNDELINTFAGGKAGLRAFADEADRTGQVIEDALLRRNEEIGDQWDAFTGRLSTSFKSFVLSVVAGAADARNAILEMRAQQHNWLVDKTGIGERMNADGSFGPQADTAKPGTSLPRTTDALMASIGFTPRGKTTVMPSAADKAGENEAERLRKQYDEAVLSLEKQTAALKTQAATMGMSAGAAAAYTKQQELMDLAVKNHIELTKTQKDRINDVAEAYGKATAELERMKDAQEAQNFLARSLFDAVRGADSLADAFANLANKIADAALEAALLGSGPLAGLFGTKSQSGGILGTLVGAVMGGFAPGATGFGSDGIGHNAAGNDNWRGGPTWVGEQGPEILNLPRGSQIIPFPKAMAATGASSNIQMGDIHVHMEGSSGDPDTDAKQARAVAETVRGVVREEIFKATKIGGQLNQVGA